MKNLNVITEDSPNFLSLSPDERISLFVCVRESRKELLRKNANKKKRKKATSKKSKKKMTFKSDELKKIFEAMPPEFQKFVSG